MGMSSRLCSPRRPAPPACSARGTCSRPPRRRGSPRGWSARSRRSRRARREGLAPSGAERRRLAALAAGSLLRRRLAARRAAARRGGGARRAGASSSPPSARGGARYRDELRRGAAGAARALADAVAAGHSVRGALDEVAPTLPGAAGHELRLAARALALGEPTDAVLERLRARAATRAWDTLVAAILLQRDAGGDLPALLRELAAALEAADRLERDARAATAQARFTAWLVVGLPARRGRARRARRARLPARAVAAPLPGGPHRARARPAGDRPRRDPPDRAPPRRA